MKKRLFMFVMICCMLISVLPVATHAAQIPEVQPQWANTLGVTTYVSFVGSTGYVVVSITGYSGVTEISGDIQLYYKNASGAWVEIPKDWAFSVNRMVYGTEVTFAASPGREYKAVMSAVVTKNGYNESISKTATEICPSTT